MEYVGYAEHISFYLEPTVLFRRVAFLVCAYVQLSSPSVRRSRTAVQ